MNRIVFAVLASVPAFCTAGTRTISVADYVDRMKGAWVGQMVGVSWGSPTEFKAKDVILPEESVPVWDRALFEKYGYDNDDVYVEMTFLRTLEKFGLSATPRQAGIDFANSQYCLWCANDAGRTNLRKGIAPPACSHPARNPRSNDIDYQIEADFSGIIAPGCPQTVIRFGDLFGRLMNYGDGVWAGQFVGAMYAEAFFASEVDAVLDAGLAAIPRESDYAEMVRRIRAWHGENPSDWTACWEKARDLYSTKAPGYRGTLKDSNGHIDARLNGAAVVIGLLYGKGDLDLSMRISMRCGWDSDCNPSTVGGVLATMRGFAALPERYRKVLRYDVKFPYTDYDLGSLFATCEKLARAVVSANGGRVVRAADGTERFEIPVRTPVPDPWVPSWKAPPYEDVRFSEEEMKAQRFALRLPDAEKLKDPDPTRRVQKALDALWPGWKTGEIGPDLEPGYVESADTYHGKCYGLVRTHPPRKGVAAVLSRELEVPTGNPTLHFAVASHPCGDFRLRVRIDGADVLSTVIEDVNRRNWYGHLQAFDISLEPWSGKRVRIELVNEPNGWNREAALWHGLRITADNGDVK